MHGNRRADMFGQVGLDIPLHARLRGDVSQTVRPMYLMFAYPLATMPSRSHADGHSALTCQSPSSAYMLINNYSHLTQAYNNACRCCVKGN